MRHLCPHFADVCVCKCGCVNIVVGYRKYSHDICLLSEHCIVHHRRQQPYTLLCQKKNNFSGKNMTRISAWMTKQKR